MSFNTTLASCFSDELNLIRDQATVILHSLQYWRDESGIKENYKLIYHIYITVYNTNKYCTGFDQAHS